jgi:two-component system, LytTR family, sensor kinase
MKLTSQERNNFYLKASLLYLGIALLIDIMDDTIPFLYEVMNTFWRAIYLVPLMFVSLEYMFPWMKLTWKRVLPSLLLLFIFCMFCSFGLKGWCHLGTSIGIFTPFRDLPKHSEEEEKMANSMFALFLFGVSRHIYMFRKLNRTTQQLQIEKQEAELNFLKSQTNPHFLFNTLNNIYSLARVKSDLAPESILKLSKILRYMLYETGGAFVAIEQELKVINDYISLEKLRYDESLRVNFNHDIEDMKQAIPPLLLIPLVENAFKHGVSETRGNPYIDIHLSINNRKLVFHVKNSTGNATEKTIVENIGLSNLRRQLVLLYTDYDLTVKQEPNAFVSTLTINLSSHV